MPGCSRPTSACWRSALDRRTQLVSGVGHEGRQPVTGVGQAAEHGVEGPGQVADLVGGVRLRQALVDVCGGDLAGGRRHRRHRGQGPTHEAPGHQPDQGEQQGHADGQGLQQGPGGLVGAVEGPADQDGGLAVGRGDAHDHEAVPAHRGVVDDRRRLVAEVGDGGEPVDVRARRHDGAVGVDHLDEGVLLVLDREIGGLGRTGLQSGGHVLRPELGGLPDVAGQ